MNNYIGLGTSPHDSSLAIIDKNGELVFAQGAERPLQSKRALGYPPDHISHTRDIVNEHCDLSLGAVVGCTWQKSPLRRYHRLLMPLADLAIKKAAPIDKRRMLTGKYFLLAHDSLMEVSTIGLELAFDKNRSAIKRKYFDHHLTHAAAAAFASPFNEGVCVVIDGFGENGSIDAFAFRNGQFHEIKSVKSGPRTSLGIFYGQMCDTCGFDPVQGEEWKVMGLAAYGKIDQKLYDLIRPLIKVDGLRLKSGKNIEKNNRVLQTMRRKPETPAIEYADFAATTQFVFTETVQQLLKNIHALNISDNLILGGGCALNSSTNGTILETTPFKQLFVGSAPADDGNAIGAAFLAYCADNPGFKKREADVLSPYLGNRMKKASLDNLIKYCGFHSEQLDDKALFEATAKALSEGKIIGWVQGRAEFGPRALGNRSILADPRKADVKERINAEVKFREEFRPFAPSILHEYGESYFENYQFSPYMERTLRFKESVRNKVPGVVHVDGTGRLQSVTEKLNSRYYRLIKAFNDITGIPILLNTSFNVMGKPIVHSVEDAAAVFQTSGLDMLVIENRVFLKRNGECSKSDTWKTNADGDV